MALPDISKLTRNPLGVIGLFIWLIYSIAGIAFAVSASHLEYSLQLMLTLFVVIFPLCILGVFYRLVTKYHNKLYAPGDFKDERFFFRPATTDEVQAKQINELIDAPVSDSPPGLNQMPASKGDQSINYIFTESAAIDYIEQQYGRHIPRNIVTELNGRKFIFDGLYQDDKRLDIFEVKIYRRPAFKKEFIEAVMYRASSLILHDSLSSRNRESSLWLIIVTDFEGATLTEFESQMKNSVDSDNFSVHWTFVPRSRLRENDG
jgi:hypothetical protein